MKILKRYQKEITFGTLLDIEYFYAICSLIIVTKTKCILILKITFYSNNSKLAKCFVTTVLCCFLLISNFLFPFISDLYLFFQILRFIFVCLCYYHYAQKKENCRHIFFSSFANFASHIQSLRRQIMPLNLNQI